MKLFIPVFLILFVFTAVSFAQSGRKAAPKPKTTPAVLNPDDPSQYSESKPRPPKTVRSTERFPGIGDGKNATIPNSPTAPATTDRKDEDEVLRVETNLITIPVSVFDRNGLYISNLKQQDFKIFDDGIEQEIAYFGTTDKPFAVALLLDTSPSTAYKIDEIHRAAAAFVGQLEPQDSVIVIDFNSSVKIQTEATNARQKIYDAINRAKFGNGTSHYNAVDEALRKQLGRITGRKAVVLFTDGVDTTSRKNTCDGTVNYAEETDSLVFPIYYNTFFDAQGGGGLGGINAGVIPPLNNGTMSPRGKRPEDYALGRKYLEDLADVTGGRVFRPESTPGGLTAAFEAIAEELRRQYNVGFIPNDEGKPGQRKQIKVRVNRPNLVIRSRDSYIVGASSPTQQSSAPVK